MHPTRLKLLYLFLLTCVGINCNEVPVTNMAENSPVKKSTLVNRLEHIFYSEDFMSIPDKTFHAKDFGAVGDGKTLNTEAIQEAIDAASAAGGGKVVFDAGTYVSGALFLKSNVNLHLDKGVVIQAIQEDKYFPDRWTRVAGIEMEWPAALINVYEEKNVHISGEGIIDGNGKYWWDKFWGDPPRSGGMWVDYTERGIRWAVDYDCKRVRPLVVYKSMQVKLQDFTVKRAGFWTISLTFSEGVHVDGVTIRNNIGGFGPSSDGINTDSSKDILVENCDIDCNDDNLCIKAGRDHDGLRVNRPAENIVYRDCITRAGHGLFTIGSETSGGMRNIEVYGLKAVGTSTGIRFKSAQIRGGLIEQIYFHDIEMEDVVRPFQFELNWYPEYSYPTIPDTELTGEVPRVWKVMTTPVEPPEKGIPEFRNILIENINVTGAERAFYANAYPEKPIHHFAWKDIQIEAKAGGVLNYAVNWTMENVRLRLGSHDTLLLTQCSDIELPEVIYLDQPENDLRNTPIKVLLANWQNNHPEAAIIPVNPVTHQLIADNDTAAYSKSMHVYILNNADYQINYIEPLGDGFYFSPITISQKGNKIKVYGERDHEWTFYLSSNQVVKEVQDVDNWKYDQDKKQIIVKKEGMQFELVLD